METQDDIDNYLYSAVSAFYAGALKAKWSEISVNIENPENLDALYNECNFGTYIVYRNSMSEYPKENYHWEIYTTEEGFHIGNFIIDRTRQNKMVELLFMNHKGEFRTTHIEAKDLTKLNVVEYIESCVRKYNYK